MTGPQTSADATRRRPKSSDGACPDPVECLRMSDKTDSSPYACDLSVDFDALYAESLESIAPLW